MNLASIPSLLAFCAAIVLVSGRILIYQDDDIPHDVVKQLCFTLGRAGYALHQIVGPADLAQDDWKSDTQLLVLPDGRGESYGSDLETAAQFSVRQWIENGGSLLTIGAGAYIASTIINFDLGGKNEVKKNGLLPLYPGTAHGPVIQPVVRQWDQDPEAVRVTPSGGGIHDSIAMYAIGSCYFEPLEVEAAKWTSIAKYTAVKGNPPAIILGKVGNGKVLLSGPNWSIDHENMVGLEKTAMYVELQRTASQRREFASTILARLFTTGEDDHDGY